MAAETIKFNKKGLLFFRICNKIIKDLLGGHQTAGRFP